MTDTVELAFAQTTPNELLSPGKGLDFPRALAKAGLPGTLASSAYG
jgi:hypothetical protein